MSVQIKICGLSEEKTLQAALSAGADFIGFVHYPKSPRHVSIARAFELKKLLPKTIKSVLVVVNPSDDLLSEISQKLQPDFVQLHGDETLERVKEIDSRLRGNDKPIGIIKAISVCNAEDIKQAEKFAIVADYLLFDAKPMDKNMLHGGNGIAFDWELLAEYKGAKNWFLSGGLNVANVREAIQKTGAKMVDVSSGVEREAGVKDISLIENFIKMVRE